MNLVKNY